jgi:hypothetical protein
MNWVVTLYSAILFFLLTPGILLRLPPTGGKFLVAAVHAVVFALVWHFTHKLIWQLSVTGFRDGFDLKESKAPKAM